MYLLSLFLKHQREWRRDNETHICGKGDCMSDIEVRHLSKSFELKGETVDALKDINLSIKPGDIYGIIGMSGAGKSTLVRCLNFLERPTEGEVLVGGKDLSTLTEKELRKQRQEIAMIFQHFNLLMQKNVLENVCFPLYIQGKKKSRSKSKSPGASGNRRTGRQSESYPAQLSGGQKQRVAIARAWPPIRRSYFATKHKRPGSPDHILHT